MKHFFVVLLFLNSLVGFSQYKEFGESANGLIYPDSTITQLKHIVDSLNLKFKYCDLNKTYIAKPQAKGHYVYLEKGDVVAAAKDMKAGISFESFVAKYPLAVVTMQTYVVKYSYQNYKKEDIIEFSSLVLNDGKERNIQLKKDIELYNRSLKDHWVYDYTDSTQYYGAFIKAFYFLEDLKQPVIPEAYARMIQYSDCLVDTTEKIFYDNAEVSDGWWGRKTPDEIKAFMNYLNAKCPEPNSYKKNEKAYRKKYDIWYVNHYIVFDKLHQNDPKFNTLLKAAVQAGIEQGGTYDEFEEYVGRYVSKDVELEMKRHRKVQGMCSMDQSPRYHALDIAMLSAETNHWEIFLRSHLDIMNDRFDRMSDGSYAYGRRQTYIKELEVLDINVLNLLLGISIRIENPSSNHYFGSIARIGRALSESRDASKIEAMMLTMISDQNLDINNRVTMYYLFLNYNYYLIDEKMQKDNMEKLHKAVLSMPDFLAVQWTEDK